MTYRLLFLFFAIIFTGNFSRGDIVLSISSSETSFNSISSFTINNGSSGSSISNRLYLFAESTDFSSNDGLGGFKLNIGSAGSLANIGSVSNLQINPLFDNRAISYNGGIGTLEGSTNISGVQAISNRIYLGYFGLNGVNAGTANLSITVDNNPGFWFYGNLNDSTVNPSSVNLTVNVASVPEPGTIILFGSSLATLGFLGIRKKQGREKTLPD
jgi:hypothetical protein